MSTVGMRMTIVTILAALTYVVGAQECTPCGTVELLGGNLINLGTCPAGTTCTDVTSETVAGLIGVTIGVSIIQFNFLGDWLTAATNTGLRISPSISHAL